MKHTFFIPCVFYMVGILLGIELSPLFSQEISFSGTIGTQLASAVNKNEEAKFLTGGITAEGELQAVQDESSFYIDGKIEYNAVQNSTNENYGEKYDGRLKEAWYDYEGGWYSVRIGRQITAWGAADGLIVADVLCPQDTTALFAENISESRLGIDAFRFSLHGTSVICDFYSIPFFTPAKLPLKETDLLYPYVFGTMKTKGISLGTIDKPIAKLENMEYAMRLSTYLSVLDFSIYGFYGYQDEPVFFLDKATLASGLYTLDGEYKKYSMVGMDMSIPIGEFTLRAESAWYINKTYALSTYLDSESHDEMRALCGFDWMHGDWTITGQYMGDYITGDVDKIGQDEYTQTVTLNIAYAIPAANLELSTSGVLHIEDLDSVLKVKAAYDLSDAINLSITGMFFNEGPDTTGKYGVYKDLSCVVLKGEYKF
ncbi:MAG: hypothetical protein K6E51_01905 [Treponema sp.]|nr:hypothetical protein [Treponema sp.]